MNDLVVTPIDKSKWGEGPWQGEPDRKEWRDAETGLPCLAVRGPLGNWCGYAGVAEDHPAYGLHYDGIQMDTADHLKARFKAAMKLQSGGASMEDSMSKAYEGAPSRDPVPGIGEALVNITIHGGLTYANSCAGKICHTPEPGEPDNVWWFRFDCAHCDDWSPGMRENVSEDYMRHCGPGVPTGWGGVIEYRTLGYVESECASLAKQLAALANV